MPSASACPTVTSSHCNLAYALARASCVMSPLAYISTSTPACRAHNRCQQMPRWTASVVSLSSASACHTVTSSHCSLAYALARASYVMSPLPYMFTSTPA